MKDLVRKVAVGLASTALVAQSLVIPSFAEINVVVSGNGSESNNDVDVDINNATQVNQSNEANVSNNVNASANTGGNDAEDNTGGGVSIDTGDAEASATVVNAVNSNEAVVEDCGGCPGDLKVEISGNGSDSHNEVDVDVNDSHSKDPAPNKWISQTNSANVTNDVNVKANSGYNDAEDNTGGDVEINTGSAIADAVVVNQLNANVAWLGGSNGGALELIISGNGSDSHNDLDVDLNDNVGVLQNNYANVSNEVDVDANTGKNDAEDNTGGTTSIDTGDAEAGAMVDTMANFNAAYVADCCLFDGLVKIAGNGTDSENDIDLDLASSLYTAQDNLMACGGHNGLPSPFPALSEFPFGGHHRQDCNEVEALADSGKNDAKDNTGDPEHDPSIDTGNAATTVEVATSGNSNVFSTGDAIPSPSPFPWEEDGNMNWWVWILTGHMEG